MGAGVVREVKARNVGRALIDNEDEDDNDLPFLKGIDYGANGHRLEAYATLGRRVVAMGPRS